MVQQSRQCYQQSVCFFNNEKFQSHLFVKAMTYAQWESMTICKFQIQLLCWPRQEELSQWNIDTNRIEIKLGSTIKLSSIITHRVVTQYFLVP